MRLGRAYSDRLLSVCLALFLPLLPAACAWEGEAGEHELERAGPTSAPSAPADPSREPALAVASPPGEKRHPHRIEEDTHLFVENNVAVMTRRSGIVREIFVDRGTTVREGDPLLRLENHDLELYVKRAEIERERAEREYVRAQSLREQKLIPEADFEARELDRRSAGVEVEITREELEKSWVRAPFDGLVAERYARVGQKVVEDEDAPLFQITALAGLQARLYLPEPVARNLAAGHEVEVRPRYLPGMSFPGRLQYISPVVDSSSGTILAIISVPRGGPPGPLLPGSAVTVGIDLPPAEGEVLVPRAAFPTDQALAPGEPALVEVWEGGKRTRRRVVVGDLHDDRVGILEGLRPGERVVLQTDPPRPGMEERSDGND